MTAHKQPASKNTYFTSKWPSMQNNAGHIVVIFLFYEVIFMEKLIKDFGIISGDMCIQ